jgi:hypothetical protein
MENKETKPNNSAFPIIAEDYIIDGGLTKREYFASMALQGLLSMYGSDYQVQIAKDAIYWADSLIEELNKTKQDEK